MRGLSTVAAISFWAAGSFSLATVPPNNSADLAVIDRALATAKEGDKFVRFGDVGITIENLRVFRARLIQGRQGKAGIDNQVRDGEGAVTSLRGAGAPRNSEKTGPGAGRLHIGAAASTGGVVVPNADTPNGTAFKWPGGNVYYRFDPAQVSNGTITAAKMRQFRDSVAEWTAFANVHFIENITGQPNYVTVQEANISGGFSSSVGMAGGEQFVQFGPAAWNRGTICHEVGHVLGFYHEQQRDDRDSYVVINFQNMDPGQQGNFTKLPGGSVAQGPYDFFSVMHYARKALSNNGQDTISMQPAYAQYLNIIGAVSDRTLSKLDRAGMAAVYGAASPAPGAVVTTTNDSGPGSLRSAIYYAFDLSPSSSPAPVSPTSTTILFHIPNTDPNFNGQVYTIKPTYIVTAPGDGTTIDATAQTLFTGDTNLSGPEVVLDGSVQAQYEFAGTFGPAFILRQANCAVKGFVIHGFDRQGIRITSDSASGSVGTGNSVSGCYIGTDETGTASVGNGSNNAGVEIIGGANHNLIGGLTAAARNVISGSFASGISIHDSGTNNNVVEGNYIGLNAAGSATLANRGAGIEIVQGAQNNIVGGTTSAARNVISGNVQQGIVIVGSGTIGNFVQGNYIGLNAAGTSAAGNGSGDPVNHLFYSGIDIFGGAQNNTVGGSAAGAGNVISGNIGPGMTVSQASSNGNTIQGNFVGTNAAGTAAVGNGFADPSHGYSFAGVEFFGGAQSNTIGGIVPGSGNVVSGNAAQGIFIGDTGTTGNLVQGNILGLNAAGTGAIGNGSSGVLLYNGAQSNTIGGANELARNVIAGNSGDGITIALTGTSSNNVQGNFIGLTMSGAAAVPNAGAGVSIFGAATSNLIGGTSAGARNYISGNNSYGVVISSSGTNGNVVQGNTIGLLFTGGVAGNSHGVAIFGGPQSNTIGGTGANAGNMISANANEGIAMFESTDNKDAFSRNSIFGNGARGIALYNGANNSQPAPALNGATLGPIGNLSGTGVSASLTAAANATYTIEYFASSTADPSGFGEGQYFLGSTNVTMNGSGSATFSIALAPAVPAGYVISATATDALGNTSEFSNALTVVTSDADSDGIPDNWTNSFFGHSTGQAGDHSRATDDADGDGMTNAQEFVAGLDPKNSNSVLRISSVTRSGDNTLIGFRSVTGKIYQLQYRDDLATGNWLPLTDGIVGTGATLQVNDSSSTGLTKRFYRVALRP